MRLRRCELSYRKRAAFRAGPSERWSARAGMAAGSRYAGVVPIHSKRRIPVTSGGSTMGQILFACEARIHKTPNPTGVPSHLCALAPY